MSTHTRIQFHREPTWFKSSYSSDEGGDCIEAAWFKSSYSNSQPGDCLEAATTPATIHIRDSKDITRAHLSFTPKTWAVFVAHAQGE